MGSAQNFVWQSVGFWEICGIFKLEFQCPDKKIWTRFYAKIEFAVYIIYKHISAFIINTTLTLHHSISIVYNMHGQLCSYLKISFLV